MCVIYRQIQKKKKKKKKPTLSESPSQRKKKKNCQFLLGMHKVGMSCCLKYGYSKPKCHNLHNVQ